MPPRIRAVVRNRPGSFCPLTSEERKKESFFEVWKKKEESECNLLPAKEIRLFFAYTSFLMHEQRRL